MEYVSSNVTSLAELPAYRARFAAADRLRDATWRARPKQIDSSVDHVGPLAWGTAVRALKSFSAVLVLCDKGFGEQSAMIARSLFEDFAVVRWIVSHPDDVRQRFLDHAEHTVAHRAEALIKHDLGHLAEMPPLSPEERTELDKAFGSGGQKHWTQRSVHRLLLESEADLSEEERRKTWLMHDLFHRINNLLLHNSPTALSQTAYGPTFTLRPSERNVADALLSSYFSVSRIALVVATGGARDGIEELVRKDEPLFTELRGDDIADVGRNDPCPCGSGRKYKACHGR